MYIYAPSRAKSTLAKELMVATHVMQSPSIE